MSKDILVPGKIVHVAIELDNERVELWHVALDQTGPGHYDCIGLVPPDEPKHETGVEFLGTVYWDQGAACWVARTHLVRATQDEERMGGFEKRKHAIAALLYNHLVGRWPA